MVELEDFLQERGPEVLKAMTIDMTFEHREEIIRREERAEGRAEGAEVELISIVIKKVAKKKTLNVIADELEEECEHIRPMYDVVVANPEKTAKEIYDILHASTYVGKE